MKKAMLIVNPSAGKEQSTAYAENAATALEQNGYEVTVKETKGEGCATRFAKEACTEQFDCVVAMGGDGTMNETVNGLAEQPHRPKFGLIPLGTVNDFARALNIPLKPEEAIELLKDHGTKAVDIGKINDRYFMNVVAVGALAEATFAVSPEQKTKLGPLAYFIEGAKTIKEKQPFDAVIEHDAGRWDGEVLILLIALTNSVGGFETISPDAKVNDGMLHVFIIKDVSFLEFAALLPSLFKGDLKDKKQVEYIQTCSLTLSSSKDMIPNIDGDEGGSLPITVKNLERHLQVIVPEKK
ncbi:diacylglycerol/lipid kinase family protein [Fictibacillus aquaticus]|uniref:Sphingosine kinase n=1 Tax=Fictibacillus aquaticus TaxID=2021314 RepID=A0A235FDR3_9BACL|nr:YegS/Rv2252/BmrU family lipid kinase [Fictibacillus aquaticus]OYD59496.1 sphingosine kinase [Fictibacillus aquaticus]